MHLDIKNFLLSYSIPMHHRVNKFYKPLSPNWHHHSTYVLQVHAYNYFVYFDKIHTAYAALSNLYHSCSWFFQAINFKAVIARNCKFIVNPTACILISTVVSGSSLLKSFRLYCNMKKLNAQFFKPGACRP